MALDAVERILEVLPQRLLSIGMKSEAKVDLEGPSNLRDDEKGGQLWRGGLFDQSGMYLKIQ